MGAVAPPPFLRATNVGSCCPCSVSVGVDCFDGGAAPIHALVVQMDARTRWSKEWSRYNQDAVDDCISRVAKRRPQLSWEFCCSVSVGVDCFDGGAAPIHALLAHDGRTCWLKQWSRYSQELRELKMWLYREGWLETSLPVPSGGPHGGMDLAQVGDMVALSCATGDKNDGNAVMFDRIGSQGRTRREMASF